MKPEYKEILANFEHYLDSINQKIDEITNEQDNELMQLIKKRNIVKSALLLQKNYILPGIEKIINKLK